MTTDGLTKFYDKLLPAERHALILAADLRGDEAEAERLLRTAPRLTYSVPHHHLQAEAFQLVALVHLAQLLHLSSAYWQALVEALDGADLTDEALQGRLDEVVRGQAYLLCTYLRGWELFCAGLTIPPDVLKLYLPEWPALQETRESAQSLAFTAPEAAEWAARLRRRRGEEGAAPPRVITAEDVAAALRRAMPTPTATGT
jgi:hypothetical protein